MVCVWERERLLSSLCLDASKQHWISPLRPLQLIKTPRHPSTLTRTTHKHNPCHAHHIQRKGTLNVHAARTSSEQATNEVKSLSASSVTPTTRARARSPRPDLRHTAQSERVIARARHIQKTMLLRRSSGAAALATTAAPTPRARAVVLVAPPTAARSTSSSRSAPSPSPAAPSCRRGDAAVAHARYRGGGGGGGGYIPTPSASSPSVADRLIAAVPWLLPLLDAFSYGRFLFYQYPLAARAVAPLAPLVSLYASVPFAPLVCFFGLYLGVVNNARVARFARFSAMQAVLVDILLVLPRLLESLASPPAQGWGLKAYITAQNSIWVLVAATVVYGIASALLGKVARVPFVAEAADAQIAR